MKDLERTFKMIETQRPKRIDMENNQTQAFSLRVLCVSVF
jgi:hypothetical protein